MSVVPTLNRAIKIAVTTLLVITSPIWAIPAAVVILLWVLWAETHDMLWGPERSDPQIRE